MSGFNVDLSNCDVEPIHIPGQIQSHGFIIVIDEKSIIRFCSDNINNFIPVTASRLLGRSINTIEKLIGAIDHPDFITQLVSSGKSRKGFEKINPVPVAIAGISFYLIISRSANQYILEFEMATSSNHLDLQSVLGSTLAEILTYTGTVELVENAAIQVKQVIDFDRVMIYKFAADGHGEVVAEAKNDDLSPWLGLHYPASDIPQQARELYRLNLTRLIADVNDVPARIIKSNDTDADLDLTYSQLRAVSPMHIQYLKNMGVVSSFSISLKHKDELWGLIACHNYTKRFIDFKSRAYAKLIGQILSSALEFRENEEILKIENDFNLSLQRILKQLMETERIETALISGSTTLLDIVKSSGAILVHHTKIYKLGNTPTDQQLLELMYWINDRVKDGIFETENLSSIYPPASTYKHSVSGMLIAVLARELGDYLVWFRAEKIQTVNWAGLPDKALEFNDDGLPIISPRTSFEVWTETVLGVSESWSVNDVKSAIKLKEEINYGLNHKAGTARILNERLRMAYEELETFSYTISHDLKNPIASIKSYAQLLIRDQNILERGQMMLQRIADRADQMNLMISAVLDYSRIGRAGMLYRPIKCSTMITDIVKDLPLIYNVNNLNIIIGDTPDLRGDPIMIMQVFSNLISNAVKYSQLGGNPEIHISGVEAEDKIIYRIRDNGIGIALNDLTRVFELFNRMDNVKDIEGSGVGLAIVKRIIEKHQGSVTVESQLGAGSTFIVTFNNSF